VLRSLGCCIHRASRAKALDVTLAAAPLGIGTVGSRSRSLGGRSSRRSGPSAALVCGPLCPPRLRVPSAGRCPACGTLAAPRDRCLRCAPGPGPRGAPAAARHLRPADARAPVLPPNVGRRCRSANSRRHAQRMRYAP
jgi:hypothetical protein